MTKKTKLVVTRAFRGFAVGAEITETADIKKYRASHPHHVVATEADTPEADDLSATEPAVKTGLAHVEQPVTKPVTDPKPPA